MILPLSVLSFVWHCNTFSIFEAEDEAADATSASAANINSSDQQNVVN